MTHTYRRARPVLAAAGLIALTVLITGQSAQQPAGAPASHADLHVQAAKQAQQRHDLAAAVQEYRLAVEADPANADAHAGLISATQSREYANAGLDKADTTAERRTALYAGHAAAEKVLLEFYRPLEVRYPNNAAVQWALGRVYSEEPDVAEPYYRKALALDPTFARAYLEIGRLAQQADNRPKTLEFFRKASEADPGNDNNAYLYATALKPVDRAQFLSAVNDLIRRFPKSSWAARALADSAVGAPPSERVQAYERMQREFPAIFRDGYATRLFDAYVSAQSEGQAVQLARAQLASAPAGRQQDQWKGRVAYGEAVVEARRLQKAGEASEACAFVDKTLASQSLELSDREPLHLIWAAAAASSGNTIGALDRLIDVVAASPTRAARAALEHYRSAARRNLDEVESAVWQRRTKTALPMADFELKRLDTGAKVHLADLRGKVVMVNFWFPT